MILSSKFSSLLKNVTVEPMMFFACMWHEIFFFVDQNLYLQKACRDHTLSAPDLDTPCDDEKRGLVYISSVFNNISVVGSFWAILFVVYASNYSDAAGGKRKIFLVLTIIAMALQTLWAIAQIVFWYWPPLLGVIVSVTLQDIFGGYISLHNFVHAYIFDTTSKEDRLTKLIVLGVIHGGGNFVGKGCAGFLLRKCGFLFSTLVCLAIVLVALVNVMVFVKEKESASAGQQVNLSRVFNLKPLYEMVPLILFPKKPMKSLVSIWTLLLVSMLLFLPFMGERSVVYLYLRYRFHWNEEKYSVYTAFRVLSVTIGSMLCTLVMRKWLKIDDAIIGTFAAFCDTLSVIGFYFAIKDWQLYAVTLFDMFHGLAQATALSLLSHFFTEKEFGRLNSMRMIFIWLGSCGIPLYSMIFKKTMDTHPPALFLLSVFVNAITVVLYCVTYFCGRGTQSLDAGAEIPS